MGRKISALCFVLLFADFSKVISPSTQGDFQHEGRSAIQLKVLRRARKQGLSESTETHLSQLVLDIKEHLSSLSFVSVKAASIRKANIRKASSVQHLPVSMF